MVEMWDSGRDDDLGRKLCDEMTNSSFSLISHLNTTAENHLKKLETIRNHGNELFSLENWRGAVECYSDCITLSFGFLQLDNNNEIFERFDRSLLLAYSNRAEARLRLGDYELSLADADNALRIDPRHVKALVRKGKAAHRLGLFEKACQAFKAASEECPEELSIRQSLKGSTIAYEQSETGKYDLTDFFSKGCTGEIPFCADFVGPVEIRRANNVRGGRGLFATRNLRADELLLVSNPLAVIREKLVYPFWQRAVDGNHRVRILEELTKELAGRIMRSKREMARLCSLASNRKQEIWIPLMDLFRPGTKWITAGDEESDLDMDFIFQEIVCKKRFEYLDYEGPKWKRDVAELTGLWILPAFANHSCAPNCQHSFVGDTLFFRASGHIMEGEELTVAYFHDLLEDVASRQAYGENWLFTCKCERCLFEENLQPQLSKIIEVNRELVDAAKVGPLQTMNQKGRWSTKVSKAIGEVEAVIQSLGCTLSKKQQGWIRAALIALYMENLELALKELGAQSRIVSITVVVDSMTSISMSPIVLRLAARLVWEVEEYYTRKEQIYRHTLNRVLDIYRAYFGKLPKATLYNLIKGNMHTAEG